MSSVSCQFFYFGATLAHGRELKNPFHHSATDAIGATNLIVPYQMFRLESG